MSQTGHRDLEGGPVPDGNHNERQSPPNQPLQLSKEESEYSNSSWTLYSMYSKIAEDEDNKMVERCLKDADGTLIFTGLFSATVGALLTISFPDLKPNSQDTSAFYLQNIYQYQVFGDPNASLPSIPSALAKPLAFSPPRYTIWVNSLWFLSLTVSLSGALVATLFRNWAVQYISVIQWDPDTLPKRARMRALFAQGNPGPYIIWGTNQEHTYLHFSFLLFVAGSLIYLFNINRAVFYAVVSWVGWMTIHYTYYTSEVFFEPHHLLHTPLSTLVLSVYLSISYLVFRVFSCIPPLHGLRDKIRSHYHDLNERYSDGILKCKQSAAEEAASKPSSEIDSLILERILLTLDEDHASESFFDAIPGFCKSRLCVLPLSSSVRTKLRQALDGFLNRTFSSNLVSESAQVSRLITCLDAAHAALEPNAVLGILDNIFNGHWDKAPQSVEIGHALRLWGHRRDHELIVQQIIAHIIARVRERDDRWTTLVTEEFDVPDDVLRDSYAHGDSVLLFILIHISRESIRVGSWNFGILSSLSKFNIRNALPGIQHEFCSLWNEIAQKAGDQGPLSTSARILRDIRHLYIALHRDTDFAPTAFSASTGGLNSILERPLMYPQCDIPSHLPDSTTRVPVALVSDAVPPSTPLGVSSGTSPHQSRLRRASCPCLRPAEEAKIITGLPSPPYPSTTSEIGETSDLPTATFLGHSSSPSADGFSQDGVATAQRDTASAAKLSDPVESNNQQGPATPYVASPADVGGILSTVPASAPVEISTTPVLDKSSGTYEASSALISKSSLTASSGGLSAPESPESPPPPNVTPLPTPEPLSLVSGMSLEAPSDDATPLYAHSRKLDDNENMYLASAVLQSLVYCPPFRELFRDLDHREGGETGGGVSPLVDATVRFLDEFAYKEKSLTHQATRGKVKEDEDVKNEGEGVHSFLSTDVYDALKQKRQFIIMRDDRQQDAAVFLGLYLEALDEELVTLQSSIGKHKPSSAPKVDELEEERDCTAGSVKSPISRIFGGRSRLTVRALNQPDTVTVEDWGSLKLNIQHDSVHTIQDALAHVSLPQPVRVGNSGSGEANQQVLLEALPPVLILHLERFLYDAAADGKYKIRKPVQFAPELEIPHEIMVPISGKYLEPAHYKLCGTLYHHGESASGHYTVDVFHPNGDNGGSGAWLHIDEGAVSTVQHEDVFGGHNNEQVDDRCAYMLFYCRTAPART